MKYFVLLTICLLLIYSCNERNVNSSKKVKYYLLEYQYTKNIPLDTMHIQYPDTITKDMIASDTADFKYKEIRIIKFTSNLHLGADWSFVAFWEKNVGTFYMRTTLQQRIYRLESSSDSINNYINTLISLTLARPKLFSIPNVPPNDRVDE